MDQTFSSLGKLIRLKEGIYARASHLFVRNFVYKFIYDMKKPQKKTNDLGHREKGVISAIAGGFGTLVSHGFETVMVRKIADVGRSSKFIRSDYMYNKNAGLHANILKNMILNGVIIWPYDQIKERMYITFGETFLNVPIALVAATVVGSFSTIVFDNLKTRLQAAYSTPELNRLNYLNASDALRKSILHEGGLTFLAGYYPLFIKMYLYALTVG
jgi:hypothetical protein